MRCQSDPECPNDAEVADTVCGPCRKALDGARRAIRTIEAFMREHGIRDPETLPATKPRPAAKPN